MKQIIQSFKTGYTTLEEVPAPLNKDGFILIKSSHSLVSLGTERMLVDFAKSSLLSKARQQPDKVKEVLQKIKSEGLSHTINTVKNKLDQEIPLGYCNVGRIVEIGKDVKGFSIGDMVVSNGPHAELISVPKNLVARVPDGISEEEATFTVIGSISLQGIRLLKPTFGETFVVIGLGLIGLITCQLLKANGCSVIAIDIDEGKCVLAEKVGIKTVNSKLEDPIKSILDLTNQIGADGVLITASSQSNEIISQAASISRKKGRIVLIGVIGLDIKRSDFYEKELTFQVSCSYGPGRYDENYEINGIDYPMPYVRWSAKRNFEAILKAIENGSLNVQGLITERVQLKDYKKIYENINSKESIATIISYPDSNIKKLKSHTLPLNKAVFSKQKCVIGIIGAGNFTKMTLLPTLKTLDISIKSIASSGGLNGTLLAKKHGITQSTTNYKNILNDQDIDTVLIVTRHNNHAKMVIESLNAGKNTFVEKPLAINIDEIAQIESVINQDSPSLMVGFNRRFSSHIQSLKKSLGNNPGPLNIIATMNSGFIPKDHWVHDTNQGGGRIIGEACHLIDVCVFLTGSLVRSVCMNALGTSPSVNTDNASIILKFENGSNAVVNYFSNGNKKYSKEKLEVYSKERVWVVDNYQSTKAYGVKGFKNLKTKLDKGHQSQFNIYMKRIKNGGDPLIALDEILNVSRASIYAIESMKSKAWLDL